MRASIAYVEMEGHVDSATVLIGEGTSIIGVGLMKKFGYNLFMDFKMNIVQLEQL